MAIGGLGEIKNDVGSFIEDPFSSSLNDIKLMEQAILDLNNDIVKIRDENTAIEERNIKQLSKLQEVEAKKAEKKVQEQRRAYLKEKYDLETKYNNKNWVEQERNYQHFKLMRDQIERETMVKQLKIESEERMKAFTNEEFLKRERNIKSEEAIINRTENLRKNLQEKLKNSNVKWDDERNKKAEKNFAKMAKLEEENAKKKERREKVAEASNQFKSAFDLTSSETFSERWESIKKSTTNEAGAFDINKLVSVFGNLISQLDNTIENIASNKSAIDTRLQGSNNKTGGGLLKLGSSYWDAISSQITGGAALSPLVRQADIVEQVKTLVGQGISFNVTQRAFLNTIKDKIATTFNAADGTLLRLIRIQQQDSTAARLGMESMLTSFMNNMYETTEYLQNLSTNVRQSLMEAMALQSTTDAVAFEYQVQKWLGSFYSLGMSDAAVQSIAGNLGKLAAGQIEGITQGGTGNLLVMAANQANLPIDVLLANGLDESNTNKLLKGMSEYLREITDMSSDNLVVQQQIANVYGLTAADLRAIANMYADDSLTANNIYKSMGNYSDAINQLENMANSMWARTSGGELLTNAFSNLQYTLSAGIASNPVTYSIFKIGNLLKGVSGGIAIPAISVFGSGVDLETTVSDLMLVGAMSGGILSSIANIVGAGGNAGLTGKGLLKGFGVDTSKISTVSRGNGGNVGSTLSGLDVSQSGMTGNSDYSDIKDKTLSDAKNDANNQLTDAKDESEEATTTMINDNIISILELLQRVTNGTQTMHVKVDDYGLTGWN